MGFYDRKLQQTAQPQTTRLPAAAITPQQTHVSQGPPDVSNKTRMAQAAQDDTGYCPGCGSGNYVGPTNRYEGGEGTRVTTDHGMVTAAARCFDCGYNPKMGTILAGLGTPSGMSGSQGTKQTGEGGMIKSNFHPQDTRAGRIG